MIKKHSLFIGVFSLCLKTLSLFASCEELTISPSLHIAQHYLKDHSSKAENAFSLIASQHHTVHQVSQALDEVSCPDFLGHTFMKTPEAVALYREILASEASHQACYRSYHGYDAPQAGLYDFYTTVAETLKNNSVQQRSRFCFPGENELYYQTAHDFLANITFDNDQDPAFTPYAISSVPHLFCSTRDLGESCLTGLFGQFSRTSHEKIASQIASFGFNPEKYISLIKAHLSKGSLTRFTFSSANAFDEGTYCSANIHDIKYKGLTPPYGIPFKIQMFTPSSSYVYDTYLRHIHKLEKGKTLYFNMKLYNVFVPAVYNDASKVITQTFSLDEAFLGSYYNILRGFIKEDIKALSREKLELALKWLG